MYILRSGTQSQKSPQHIVTECEKKKLSNKILSIQKYFRMFFPKINFDSLIFGAIFLYFHEQCMFVGSLRSGLKAKEGCMKFTKKVDKMNRKNKTTIIIPIPLPSLLLQLFYFYFIFKKLYKKMAYLMTYQLPCTFLQTLMQRHCAFMFFFLFISSLLSFDRNSYCFRFSHRNLQFKNTLHLRPFRI